MTDYINEKGLFNYRIKLLACLNGLQNFFLSSTIAISDKSVANSWLQKLRLGIFADAISVARNALNGLWPTSTNLCRP